MKLKPDAAERRASLYALARRIADMGDADRAELASRCPVVTIEGRALSGHNQCLIASQHPAATVVGGFRQWIKAGRCVRKGEHGIGIWIPRARAKAEDEETKPGFIIGYVFDVSQTSELSGSVTDTEARSTMSNYVEPPEPEPVQPVQMHTASDYFSTEFTRIK